MIFVTGKDRGRENFPEITSIQSEGLGPKVAAGFVATPDNDARKDILKKNVEGVSFVSDKHGNEIVQFKDGQQAFLNAPGLSNQDFIDLVADITKFFPAGKFAVGFTTVLGRVAAGGAASGLTSVVEDVAAELLGSEQGISGERAGLNTLFGGAGEAAAEMLQPLANMFTRKFGKHTDGFIEEGKLTKRGRKALERAGFNPDDVPPELIESAIKKSQSKEGVPSGVTETDLGLPQTRGQTTGDFDQLDLEERLRNQGNEAGEIIRNFDKKQGERALEINREIQEELAGSKNIIESEAAGGGIISAEIKQQSDDLLVAIDDAYELAGDAGASLNRDGLDNLSEIGKVIDEMGIVLDPELVPSTIKALNRIEKVAGKPKSAKVVQRISELEAALKKAPNEREAQAIKKTLDQLKGKQEVDLKVVDTVRKNLASLQGSAKNREDLRGVTLLKKRFDDYIDDAFDNALFEGDDAALDLLKNARELRREFGMKFQENTRKTRSGKSIQDIGGKVTESIVERNPTDEQVVNMIFGRGKLFNPEQSAKAVDAVVKAAGKKGDEVKKVLKQIAFRRIMSPAVKNGKFSPKAFDTALTAALDKSPTALSKIFTKEELSLIKKFRAEALGTLSPEGIKNPSRTADVIARTIGRMGTVFGLKMGGLGVGALGGQTGRSIGKSIQGKRQISQAESAVSGQFILPGKPNALTISSIIAAEKAATEE